jgi:hypothetical protein
LVAFIHIKSLGRKQTVLGIKPDFYTNGMENAGKALFSKNLIHKKVFLNLICNGIQMM